MSMRLAARPLPYTYRPPALNPMHTAHYHHCNELVAVLLSALQCTLSPLCRNVAQFVLYVVHRVHLIVSLSLYRGNMDNQG